VADEVNAGFGKDEDGDGDEDEDEDEDRRANGYGCVMMNQAARCPPRE
jgi:hypothetical protein